LPKHVPTVHYPDSNNKV